MSSSPFLSVVIPVLDDADALAGLTADLADQHGVDLDVVVVDGGSSDAPEKALKTGEERLVETEPGRGRQMNEGAGRADHDRLLFLHADTRLPDRTVLADAVDQFDEHRRGPDDGLAGRFRLRFRCDGDRGLRYRFLEAKTGIDRPRIFNGDQGLMIERPFFDQLGGYDESRPFLEDQHIGRQIDRRARWVVFDAEITTSARRFETEGFWRRYLLMSIIMGAFEANLDELFERLPGLYRHHDETERLRLQRFLGRLPDLVEELPPRRRRKLVADVGRLVRTNTWQPFVFVDVFTGGRTDALGWFERHLEGRLDHPAVDLSVGAAAVGLVAGLLPAAGRLLDDHRSFNDQS